MDIKIKKLHPDAVIPKYAKPGDAGMDLVATSIYYSDSNTIDYGTGLAFEIPEGYVGLVFPRSSNSKKDLILSNSVGVIDSGYRGEVVFKFRVIKPNKHAFDLSSKIYDIGDRIGQIIILPYPKINFIESNTLSETDRGEGGFGSTGK